jgi:sigma-E factor negative regulatory protein RseB
MTGAERLRLAALLVVLAASGTTSASQPLDVTVAGWLEKMNLAVRTLDYEGRFVYQHGDHLEALFLQHSVRDGREHERLVALNGAPREVRRDEDKAICRSDERRELLVDRGSGGRSFSPLLPVYVDQLTGHYRFTLGGETRVAGRSAQELVIQPLDNLRYGYRLALDLDSALPLRTVVVGADGGSVSQIMFTDLAVGRAEDATEDLLSWREPPTAAVPGESAAPAEAEVDRSTRMQAPRWTFAETPSGFVLNMHRRHRMEADADTEHFIFSDGLATVSVYIEPGEGSGLRGLATIGPVSAYGQLVEDHQVTAVGEVPERTVQLFGEAVRLAAGSGR